MIDLKRYQQLKDRIEQARREKDRSEGALQQLMSRLKKEFGCDSLEQASEKLVHLKEAADKAEHDFVSALSQFEEDWGDDLK